MIEEIHQLQECLRLCTIWGKVPCKVLIVIQAVIYRKICPMHEGVTRAMCDIPHILCDLNLDSNACKLNDPASCMVYYIISIIILILI